MKSAGLVCTMFVLVQLSHSIGLAEESGYQGVVQERTADDRLGSPVAEARVVFESEDGKLRKEVASGREGRYRIELPEGRYKVTVSHDGYEDHTTAAGAFSVRGPGFRTGNFFLRRPGDLQALALRDLPPAVVISVEPARVNVGEEFQVTLMALDDRGLKAIWWFGEQTGDAELDKAHLHEFDHKQFVTHTWKVKAETEGVHVLAANARDNAYGKPAGGAHQASEGAGFPRAIVTVVGGK